MKAVVHFQAFSDNDNRFIVKELAIVGDNFLTQIVFDAPYDFFKLNPKMQRSARWLSRHYHKIKWTEGSGVPYNEDLIRILCKPFSTIYTKGVEKANFLRQFHPDVREVKKHCQCVKHDLYIGVKSKTVKCFLKCHSTTDAMCAVQAAYKYYRCTLKRPFDECFQLYQQQNE